MVQTGRKFKESFEAVLEINTILQEDSSLALRQFHSSVQKFNAHQSRENLEEAQYSCLSGTCGWDWLCSSASCRKVRR
jgi:hypothetical protein